MRLLSGAVTWKMAFDCPAGMKTTGGTDSAEGLLDSRLIPTSPPAGLLMVTEPKLKRPPSVFVEGIDTVSAAVSLS